MTPAIGVRLGPPTSAVDATAFGENSLDFVCHRGDSADGSKQTLAGFEMLVGGQMATAAVGLARLGLRAQHIGALGDDSFGALVRAHLVSAGVRVAAVTREGVPSRVAVILVDRTGDREVFEYRDPRLQLRPPDVPLAEALDARVLLLDATHPEAAVVLARAARAARRPTVVDVDRVSLESHALLSEVDVAIVPEPFALASTGALDAERAVVSLAERYPAAAVVVITLGERGSLACAGGVVVRTRGFSVPVVDTTGAGDAFRAGFVAGWLRMGDEGPVSEILRFANAVAALNCRRTGAMAGLPTEDEVHALLNGRTL